MSLKGTPLIHDGRRPRIALALSGGGFRASVFHLGVLRRIAEEGWLDRVDVISTVSGGSLVGAFAVQRWPQLIGAGNQSKALEEVVIGPFLKLIQSRNFIRDWIFRFWKLPVKKFDRTYTRTKLAAELFSSRFYENVTCDQLPQNPYLILNATGLVSIRSWRFTRDGMGDSRVGHTLWGSRPLPLGECAGASAAFPPVFPPARIRRSDYSFALPVHGEKPMPEKPIIPLSDGGVYENLGVEAVTKLTKLPVGGVLQPAEFLIVSDAGYPPQYRFRNSGIPVLGEALLLYRVDDVARTQVSALRRRELVATFRDGASPLKGLLVMLGSSIEKLPDKGTQYSSYLPREYQIPAELISRIESIRTHLDKFFLIECEALMYHAYLMTDAFLWFYRNEHPVNYRSAEIPNPQWRIRFDASKVAEWGGALKDSHKRRIIWPR